MGEIEYVGKTIRPKIRFNEHTTFKPNNAGGKGKFFGRQDISMNIVGVFPTKKEALQAEYELQIFWGLTTDRSKCGPRGTKSHSAKLSESQVLEIKTMLEQKVKQKEIAKRFNVSTTVISKIKTNKIWRSSRTF